MSIEMANGEFSENMSSLEAIEIFKQMVEDGQPVRSLHIGTEKELNEIREKADMQTQLDELSAKVDSIEKPKSDIIHFPTREEIKQLG